MTMLVLRQLEETPEHFRTVLKAGGVLDVVERYPCAPAPRMLIEWLKRRWRVQRIHDQSGGICTSDLMRELQVAPDTRLPALWVMLRAGGCACCFLALVPCQREGKSCCLRASHSCNLRKQRAMLLTAPPMIPQAYASCHSAVGMAAGIVSLHPKTGNTCAGSGEAVLHKRRDKARREAPRPRGAHRGGAPLHLVRRAWGAAHGMSVQSACMVAGALCMIRLYVRPACL